MARLAAIVHVTDDNGTNHAFGPADAVPEWAASKITNPKAWAAAPEREPIHAPTPAPVKRTAKRTSPRRKAVADDTVHGD